MCFIYNKYDLVIFSSRHLPEPFAFHLLRPTEEAVSPLHVAINQRSNSDVDELLKTDLHLVKVKDDRGRTSLEFAIDLLEPSLVESILNYTQVSDCPQALHRCVSVVCHEDIPQHKRRNDSTVTESLWPRIIKKNKLVILQMLLKAGWDANTNNVGHDHKGDKSCMLCHPDRVNQYKTYTLLGLRKNTSMKWEHLRLITPLVQSALLNQHECLEILLKYCDVEYMQVLLHAALHGGGEQVLSMIVHYIKENLKDPQITSILESEGCNGKSLYHCAIERCFLVKAEALISIIYEFLGSYMSCDMIVHTTLIYFRPIDRYSSLSYRARERNSIHIIQRFLDPALAQLITKYWKTPEHGGSSYVNLPEQYPSFDNSTDKGIRQECKVHTACCFMYLSLMAKMWETAEVLFDKGAGNILLLCATTESDIQCEQMPMSGYVEHRRILHNKHLLESFTSTASYRVPVSLVERLLKATTSLPGPILLKLVTANPTNLPTPLLITRLLILQRSKQFHITNIPANMLTACMNIFPLECLQVLKGTSNNSFVADPSSITAPHKASSNTKMSMRCDFIQGGVVGAKLLSLEQATLIQDAVKLIGRANACRVHYIPYAYCFCPQSFLQHIHPHVVISTPEFMVSCPLGFDGNTITFSPIELLALMVRNNILVDVIKVDNSHNLGTLIALCCGFKYLSEYQCEFHFKL